MSPGRMLAFSLGCSALLCVGSWPSTPARAQFDPHVRLGSKADFVAMKAKSV
jgi:hypothetical protein